MLSQEFGVEYSIEKCLIANSYLVRNVTFINQMCSRVGNLVIMWPISEDWHGVDVYVAFDNL